MAEDRITPLRTQVLEDKRIWGMGETSQKAHIPALKDFAKFLQRPPDRAAPDFTVRTSAHLVPLQSTAPSSPWLEARG